MDAEAARAIIAADLEAWHSPPDLAATLRRLAPALRAIPRAERPEWGRRLIARETELVRGELAEAEAIIAAGRVLKQGCGEGG